MGFLGNVKRFFKPLLRKLWKIFKKVVSGALEVFLAEFMEIAKKAVRTLATSDLTNDDKRKEAFKRIEREVKYKYRDGDYKESWINLLIELSVIAIKKEF